MSDPLALPNLAAYPAVRRLIADLQTGIQAVFGPRLLALYLDGSLTSGDFDQDSDVDFVAVTDGEISPAEFAALQDLHTRLAQADPLWGIQLEGSYLPIYALRRFAPQHCLYPNIERGAGERLKLAAHDAPWDVHRSILRERAIVLLGPPAHELIDPVPPDQLRRVMSDLLESWGQNLLARPERVDTRGYQSYIVLSMCRVLYTLETGAITSKPRALKWAMGILDARWHGLLERAWQGRSPGLELSPDDLAETMALVRYTRARTAGPAAQAAV